MMKFPSQSDEARRALADMRSGVRGVAVLSFMIALFPVMMTLYLLLVFDVALPGHSIQTLIGITVIFLLLTATNGFFRLLRSRMLGHMGDIIATHFTPRLDEATARMGETSALNTSSGMQISRDIDAIQYFIKSPAAAAWLDIAALPILLLTMIFLHGWLALTLLIFAAGMLYLLMRAIQLSEQPIRDAVPLLARRHSISEAGHSYPDVVRALGMRSRAVRAWTLVNTALLRIGNTAREVDRRAILIAEGARMAALTVFLVVGGSLAIADMASPAVVFTAALLGWMAVSPIVQAVEYASHFVAARQSWTRLDTVLHSVQPSPPTLQLPVPKGTLACEGVAVLVPGGKRPAVQGLSFTLNAGDVLAILGPAGCGKSVALRGIAGAWPLAAGKVRLDGAALDQWDPELLGAHVGYMPQTIDLLDGTVAENIARFDPNAEAKTVVEAAKSALAHDIIVRLADGYNMRVGPNGRRLSLSQAQRIGLARALYGDPFLIALDEPASQLDLAGGQQFADAVAGARKRGAIVVLAGTSSHVIDVATHVLMMRDGMMVDFGPKDDVRKRLAAKRTASEINAAPPKSRSKPAKAEANI